MATLKPILYLQTDPKWANHDYSAQGEKTTIKAEGCGIACSAMVIASLADKKVTPMDTAEWSKSHGYKAKGQGTYYSYFKPQFDAYGLQCKMLSSSNLYHTPNAFVHKTALDAIQNGNWVIAVMGKGNWTTSGHYVLWYGMEGNHVLINDPWSTKKAQTYADYSLFRNEVKYYWVITVPEKYKKHKGDEEVVTQDTIIVNDKEYTVSMIKKDNYTYIKTRDIANILGLEVYSEGKIPALKTKK